MTKADDGANLGQRLLAPGHIDALVISDPNALIGERIDLARRLAGLELEELAGQASLGSEQLAAFGRGTGSIPLRAFLRLAGALGVTAEWLCGPPRAATKGRGVASGTAAAVSAHWELDRLRQALDGRSEAERVLLLGFVRDVARRFHLASRDLSSRGSAANATVAASGLSADGTVDGRARTMPGTASSTAEIVPLPVLSARNGTMAAVTRAAVKAAAAETRDRAAPSPAPARSRVLVVDDSADVLVALGAFVESAGYHAVRAANADEALAKLAADPSVAAIVTDYAMPDVSGVELLVQAGALRPGLPALIVTGFPDLAALTRLPAPVAVLRKPFRRQEFVSRLHALVGAGVIGVDGPVEPASA